jgi:hypothetical protein
VRRASQRDIKFALRDFPAVSSGASTASIPKSSFKAREPLKALTEAAQDLDDIFSKPSAANYCRLHTGEILDSMARHLREPVESGRRRLLRQCLDEQELDHFGKQTPRSLPGRMAATTCKDVCPRLISLPPAKYGLYISFIAAYSRPGQSRSVRWNRDLRPMPSLKAAY